MSLFDEASLVVTPNGVNTSKLYSIKPTDGSGDLDVVRNSSATRVNAEGLIEVPRTNLVTYSEEFDNAAWLKVNTTVTANQDISPNGTLTADRLQINGGGFNYISRGIASLNTTVTSSVWVKANSVSNNTFRLYTDAITGTVFTATTEWQRINVTKSVINGEFKITVPSSGDAVDILVWGAQLEVGTTATEYIPTTSVIRTRFAGITQDGAVASNIARLDYTNSSCPSILVQPQRTNLALRSEEFDNSSWAKINANISQNSTISPSGVLDADLLTSTSNSVTSNLHQTISIPSGSATFSVFAKAGNYNIFRIANASSSQRAAWFDLSTGSVIGTVNGGTASVENFGNGWFRCIFTANSVASGSLAFIISISSGANSSNAVAGANIYFWGAQLEAGSYATSYIPTVSSAVTRNQDVISKTGISGIIGQTEGTLFVDLKALFDSQNRRAITLNNGTSQNNIIVRYSTVSNQIDYLVYSGNVLQVSMNKIVSDITNQNKIIVTYKNNECKLFVNGELINTDTSATMPTSLTKLSFDNGGNTNYFEGKLNNLVLWKNALTDQECINLTTI